MTLSVLHCLTAVGGHPTALRNAERELGLDSRLVVGAPTYLGYDVDRVLGLGAGFGANQAKLWRFLLEEFPGREVVHYNFGTYAFHTGAPSNARRSVARRAFRAAYIDRVEGLDMRIAKRLGKVVAVTYQGDDARQGDWCRANYPIHFAHEVDDAYYPDDDAKRRRIDFVDAHADIIYALNPDLLNVLPARARFLPYASVDLRAWTPVPPGAGDVPHLVHAPTHATVKGTRHLLSALERLRSDGVRFRFTRVEGMSREAARRVYESADIVVDQLLAGYYGGLAVEVMALGKPVVAYMRESDLRHMPPAMVEQLPVIDATPATVYEVLKDWLARGPGAWRERGAASRAYVERWHDPLTIAQRVVADYRAARR